LNQHLAWTNGATCKLGDQAVNSGLYRAAFAACEYDSENTGSQNTGEMSMPIVRFICLLALLAGVLLYGLERVHAEVSPDVREACTPDAMRLCSEFVPDVAKITACMKAKRAQLSAACITAMRGGRHEVRREARHIARHERHEARNERHHYRTHH
jgi:hypothetical protein